jgi:hypothetical protein
VSKTVKIDGFTFDMGPLVLDAWFWSFFSLILENNRLLWIDKFVPPTEFTLGDEFIAIADNLPEIEATLRI